MDPSEHQRFVCPSCRGQLVARPSQLRCVACNAVFPVFDGLPDFRLSVEMPAKVAEWNQALALFADAPARSFTELLRERIAAATRDTEILELELRYELGWKQRGQRELSRLSQLLGSRQADALEGTLGAVDCLDVGCGKGVLLANLAPLQKHVIGIDFCVEYVCFARALLRESGCRNWSLAVAEAEHLPLRDASMGFVAALDVVEHMADQERGVAEAFRVLQPGQPLYLNSPNRYSLLAPEDHCQLWFVGFLPYSWQARYVRWRANRSYRGVRLLSYTHIKQMLKPRSSILIEAAAMVTADKGADASRAERLLGRFRILLWALNSFPAKYITPSYHFVASRKPTMGRAIHG